MGGAVLLLYIGLVAERLGRGLQNPVQEFDSPPGLHFTIYLLGEWWNGIHEGLKILCRKACGFESHLAHHGRVVKLVYTQR